MPIYKYVANRLLTAFENLFLGVKLSEYHTGYRAFSRKVLMELPLLENSDDFVFDNQMLAQCVHFGFRIGEVSCPTKYFEEASSINFRRSVKYGFGVCDHNSSLPCRKPACLAHAPRFSDNGRKLESPTKPTTPPAPKPPAPPPDARRPPPGTQYSSPNLATLSASLLKCQALHKFRRRAPAIPPSQISCSSPRSPSSPS